MKIPLHTTTYCMGILKIDNDFKLKIAVFTFKIINMNEKVPTILSDIIVAASSHHC